MAPPINPKPGPPRMERKPCTAIACSRPAKNIERQLCARHYRFLLEYGDANYQARLIHATWDEILTLVERDNDTGCLEWQGYTTDRGYGYTTYKGKRWAVYHLFWVRVYGPIEEESIHHMCLNPSCVNIAHLEPTSRSKNTREMLARRWADLPPSLCGKHDPTETVWHSNGTGKRKRRCLACMREHYAARKPPT